MPDRETTLSMAVRAQTDASAMGFDWSDPAGALDKVREETDEVARMLAVSQTLPGRAERLCEELGDLLFAVVNAARLAGVDPDDALAAAVAKFQRRYAGVKRLARLRGLPMPGTPLDELDRLWDEVKAGAQ